MFIVVNIKAYLSYNEYESDIIDKEVRRNKIPHMLELGASKIRGSYLIF